MNVMLLFIKSFTARDHYLPMDALQEDENPTRARGAQDKPYALFGTCLGAITAYEIARAVEREGNAPMPVALFPAAVSPPHLYALAVMKLYLTRPLEAGEPPPVEEVMGKLRGWEQLPKETIMMVSHALYK